MLVGFSKLVVVMAALTGPTAGAPLDAQLRDSNNVPVALAHFRGKPTVVFYEDRNSTKVNVQVKKELFARGKSLNLLSSTHIIAVADLRGFDFFPARNFALKAIRDVEAKVHIPVLVDWNRTLCQAPWGLPPERASVVILDDQGRRIYARSGSLTDADVRTFFTALAGVLHVTLPEG